MVISCKSGFPPLGRVFKLWKGVSVAVALAKRDALASNLRASAFGHKTLGSTDD